MVAVHLGLDSDSCSTAFPSTGPALLLQLCCIQYISCCRTAGGCVQLSATMCVCVRAHLFQSHSSTALKLHWL